jgi:hypothetical protein
LLRGISPLHELGHSVAARHSTEEASFRHNRQRFKIAGKELADCLGRASLPAQRLRIQAALLLIWARLSLCNGWVVPALIDVRVNSARPVNLSGQQDRRSLEQREPGGIGTSRLRRLLTERQRLGLDAPYGAAYAAYRARTLAETTGEDRQ